MKALVLSILIAAALIALMLFTGERPTSPKVEDVSELPDGWRLDEIDKAMPPYSAGGTTYVLAWKIVEDDRPLRVEECLALKHLPDTGRSDHWVLASLYRHPTLRHHWEVSVLTAAPDLSFKERQQLRQSQDFFGRPNNQQVYAFMDDAHWNLGAKPDFRLVDGRVCERAWQAGVGEKPTKFFPR
jgi:hypothetical protein